jgi:UDP-N-acetylglucosamine 2-epimerase
MLFDRKSSKNKFIEREKMKIGIIFGTRPEAIKVAPVYIKLKKNGIDVKAVVTGQHKEMLYQVLELFEIIPDYDIGIMKEGQGLSELTGRLLIELDKIVKKEKFTYILVQGDTTSALTGALVAFYNNIPVGHIEAGLRTGNIYSPFPEEANRKIIGNISNVHFTPTEINTKNLLNESYLKENIIKTGNTVIDALYWVKDKKKNDIEIVKRKYGIENKKYILLTMHRRENWGKPMEQILKAIREYLESKPNLYLVFPMHLNPLIREITFKILKDFERKILLEPLSYLEFIAVMDGAEYIMTDSGGIQEEAPSLGKPTLILRDTTERPEAISAGTAKLVGTDYQEIIKYMKLLEGDLYERMSKAVNPYGDGKASERIIKYLKENG